MQQHDPVEELGNWYCAKCGKWLGPGSMDRDELRWIDTEPCTTEDA